jgi:hypothetical protein
MRFVMLYRPGKEATTPPSTGVMAEMGKLIEEWTKAGVLLSTEGLQPSSQGVRVRITGGKFSVTDGPFSEAKEVIAGYAIVQLKSKEEAIEYAKRFLKVMGEGESEVRPMYDAPR